MSSIGLRTFVYRLAPHRPDSSLCPASPPHSIRNGLPRPVAPKGTASGNVTVACSHHKSFPLGLGLSLLPATQQLARKTPIQVRFPFPPPVSLNHQGASSRRRCSSRCTLRTRETRSRDRKTVPLSGDWQANSPRRQLVATQR